MKEYHPEQIINLLQNKKTATQEKHELQEWLLSDQPHSQEKLEELWDECARKDAPGLDASWNDTCLQLNLRNSSRNRISRFRILCRYAAMLILPLLTAVGMWYSLKTTVQEVEWLECYAPNGEIRTVILPDSTTVYLNAGSVLLYPNKFIGKKREVLLSGEANFNVARNERLPFIVKSGPLRVKVLGTRFNVEAYPEKDYITTILEEGSVCVYKSGQPHDDILLSPNDQLVYNIHEDSFKRSHVIASDFGKWTKGSLYFENKSVEEIFSSFERRYKVKIYMDPSISLTDHFTMRFNSTESIESVMKVFCQINGHIKYTIKDSVIRVYPN